MTTRSGSCRIALCCTASRRRTPRRRGPAASPTAYLSTGADRASRRTDLRPHPRSRSDPSLRTGGRASRRPGWISAVGGRCVDGARVLDRLVLDRLVLDRLVLGLVVDLSPGLTLLPDFTECAPGLSGLTSGTSVSSAGGAAGSTSSAAGAGSCGAAGGVLSVEAGASTFFSTVSTGSALDQRHGTDLKRRLRHVSGVRTLEGRRERGRRDRRRQLRKQSIDAVGNGIDDVGRHLSDRPRKGGEWSGGVV